MPISPEQLARAKCKRHLRPFAQEVWAATGFALPLPDILIDKMPTDWDQYLIGILENDFHLIREPNGFWANAR